jgi:internalin A
MFYTKLHRAALFSTPRSITNLLCLTRLCIGPSFHLRDLPRILPNLTRLQALRLHGASCERQEATEYTFLSNLKSLQSLELLDGWNIDLLPPLATLTALQTLNLSGCDMLQELPRRDYLTALQTLVLGICGELDQLPRLHNLTG